MIHMTKRSTPLNTLLLGGLLGLAPFTPAQTTEEPFVVGVCAHELHKGDPSGRAYAMTRDAGIPSVRTDAPREHVGRRTRALTIRTIRKRSTKGTTQPRLQPKDIM